MIQPPYTADNNDNSNHILMKREISWNIDKSTEATPRDTDSTNDEDASSSTRTTPRTTRKATTESSKSSSNCYHRFQLITSNDTVRIAYFFQFTIPILLSVLQNISETSSLSKRRINQKAESMFGGNVDVICSKGHFSYVYSSDLYCEATNEGITCIAFRQSSNN
ncbi:unnamed protein product [Anisakis simplex]|uniref:Ground-like domain-containing protein n=1 Tax=Anisakis simplex TaxID=6269 RepID=A0A3P6PT65_ANISI|nr:unnamed protein product [Anisakis simplex]